MTERGELLLEATGIHKSFVKSKAKVPVLRGVDFSILKGEMVGIIGSSGAGKSTLLHILGTLEPPTSGKVYFGEKREELFKLPEKALARFRNRALGFVFQFHYLLPEFSALENVMMPGLIAGLPEATVRSQAKQLLDFVGLSPRLGHRPAELSGGEQQRVAIARSVILRPRLLLADELTGNLDSSNRTMVLDLLTRLNQQTGVAILLVTHDPEIAKRMNRVLVMKDGQFVK